MTAYSPGHITGIFTIHPNGSTGAGITTQKGVTTTIRKTTGKTKTTYNQENKTITPSIIVAKKLAKQNLEIRHESELPLGAGFGVSAACALSTALEINQKLGLGKTLPHCVKTAYLAELEAKTGLGDVIAQTLPGLTIRNKPGLEGLKTMRKLPCEGKIVAGVFGGLDTKKIITNKKTAEKINQVGKKCLTETLDQKTFLKQARIFSTQTGLATGKTLQTILSEKNTTMIMLGQAVFTITKNPQKTKKIYEKLGAKTLVTKPAETGATNT